MTDLRTRIAYAIAQADGDDPGMEPASCDYEMADAVIAELGLKREETLHSVLPDYDRNTVRANVWATRYVTDWRANDE
jgi:hypothetical protein